MLSVSLDQFSDECGAVIFYRVIGKIQYLEASILDIESPIRRLFYL
jgi:hypothetical protein